MTRPQAKSIFYEPRVLWSQERIRPPSAGAFSVTMDPQRFYNGGRFPIVIQGLIISPLGYTLQRYLAPPAADAHTYHNAMSALLAGVSIRLTAPGRKHFSRRTVEVGGYRPKAVGIAKPSPSTTFASSLLGLSAWHFQFPGDEGMVLPRLCSMQLDVSGYTVPNVGAASPGEDQHVKAHLAWYERTDDFWGETARYSGALPILQKVPLPGQPVDQFWPATPNPVPDDGYGFGLPSNITVQQNLTFDSRGVFNHKRFMIEESNRGTDWDRFCGFAVALDQIDLDQNMQTATSPGVAGAPLAPLSQRVALRGKCLAGGSGEEFFFPDACPVSLACPTINEAGIVHDFDDPISLDPNAGLSIDIETPGAFVVDQEAFPGILNVGVSVFGYAIIEQG